MNEKLTDARQFLAACGWSIDVRTEGGKTVYVVLDLSCTPRRSFIPVDRLWDYARGVFDAQDFSAEGYLR